MIDDIKTAGRKAKLKKAWERFKTVSGLVTSVKTFFGNHAPKILVGLAAVGVTSAVVVSAVSYVASSSNEGQIRTQGEQLEKKADTEDLEAKADLELVESKADLEQLQQQQQLVDALKAEAEALTSEIDSLDGDTDEQQALLEQAKADLSALLERIAEAEQVLIQAEGSINSNQEGIQVTNENLEAKAEELTAAAAVQLTEVQSVLEAADVVLATDLTTAILTAEQGLQAALNASESNLRDKIAAGDAIVQEGLDNADSRIQEQQELLDGINQQIDATQAALMLLPPHIQLGKQQFDWPAGANLAVANIEFPIPFDCRPTVVASANRSGLNVIVKARSETFFEFQAVRTIYGGNLADGTKYIISWVAGCP